ncbi:transglutaminase domain-containing protein, partial [Faecalicoccus pleomorphus]|uniref:transglutaminase domain-containing protein n=1 Tax=Faecalicoccus pleomorphus TaxID=1323 RepID=UPI00196111FB
LRIEAVQIELTGAMAEKYDIYYRVHVSDYGTLGWAKNGDKAGTESMQTAIQSIEIKLLEKGDQSIQCSDSYLGPERLGVLSYSVQLNNSWQENKTSGEVAGTTGQSKMLTGLRMSIENNSENCFDGSIQYQVHFSNDGWANTVSDGIDSVSNGNGIEAIRINLTGELAKCCDVYYRTHVENLGWMGWAKNGQAAGTTKLGYHMEALEVRLVLKGTYVGPNENYYKDYLNPTLQRAHEINNSLGRDLRAAFNYAKSITYSRYEPADYNGYGSENYAAYGFATHRGNCYVMAAVFTYLAKDLGYDAHQVGGYQGSYNTPHSWVEIVINGTIYVFDPDFEKELGRNGYMFTYGTSGTLMYHSYSRMN